jgi:hypothetical protein
MTRTLRYTTAALASLGLITILACGGNGGGSAAAPTTATSLQYTDPSEGTYKLVKDASSTATHLVLNLKGPDALLSGVGFYLNADTTKVTWANVSGSSKVTNTVFTTPILAAKVTGDMLQGGVYQKGAAVPAITADPTSVLATVALDLKTGLPVNSVVALSSVNGKCVVLEGPGGTSVTTPITITVGELVAK